MSEYQLNFDGACGPKNPGGVASFGYLLRHQGTLIAQNSGIIGSGPKMSNNVAEYEALYQGLLAYAQVAKPSEKLIIRGDSKLVINQMTARWGVRKGGLYLPFYKKTAELVKTLKNRGFQLEFYWVNRERNSHADELSKAHYMKL